MRNFITRYLSVFRYICKKSRGRGVGCRGVLRYGNMEGFEREYERDEGVGSWWCPVDRKSVV